MLIILCILIGIGTTKVFIIQIDPHNATPWYYKGTAYERLSSFEHVIFCFKKAIELKPEYTEAVEQFQALEQKLLMENIKELQKLGIYRFIGFICILGAISVGILSFFIFSWSALISAIITFLMGIAWFGIARRFEIVAEYFNMHLKKK